MTLSRREFLAGTATLAAGTLAPSRLIAAIEKHSPPSPRIDNWSDLRSQFDLAPGYLHFSCFYLASHPRPVRLAIESFRRALDANPFLTVERGMFETEAANLQRHVQAKMAPYFDARAEEIALTGNTTTGLALVYHGLPLQAGDEILTTTHDHYSHHESIRLSCERSGASWRKVTLYDQPQSADTTAIVERIRRGIRSNTRVVGVTWVHSSSGVRLPIREIATAIDAVNRGRDARHRVLLVVDGVHGLGAVDQSVADLGCDYFCAGTHKWMFAPRGTGIIWAQADNWARLRPLIPTFSDMSAYGAWMDGKVLSTPTNAARVTPGGFQAYEHQWAMGAAFDLHQRLGRARVAGRIRELNDQLKEGLAGIRRVKVLTPRDPLLSAGLVAFEIDGIATDDVVRRLLEHKVVASSSPYKVSYPRLSASVVNTPADVDRALAAVRA
ncbi:MAG TPA: aminotransferase class V-fold PLP-dependent enzyme, partial [Candidatus Udaeobacter sp.]|nr:aminotransferase class V-fold PLP-dependent enzyme [Candidatus Udaeobacter sp.]